MHGENPAEINTATETFEDRDVFHDVVSRPGPRTISTIWSRSLLAVCCNSHKYAEICVQWVSVVKGHQYRGSAELLLT